MNVISTYNKAKNLFSEIRNSIAFYPTIITLTLSLLAFLLLRIEDTEFTRYIFEKLPSLFISNADTARGVLNTLIGGIFSLTVFSFSMVMILLNQASNNYSPRLLPGLITDKRHQFVLGFYLGTIVYTIICSISIIPGNDRYQIPGLSILLALGLGISCLALFVYFIHNISQSIQITNILNRLYNQIKATYENRPPFQEEPKEDVINNRYRWHDHLCTGSGFLTGISEDDLQEYAENHHLIIRCRAYEGTYLLPGELLYQTDQKITPKQQDEIASHFYLSEKNQSLKTAYVGLKHITEVALKAMSPGINDPGTAQLAIYYIIQLLALRMQTPERRSYRNQSGRILLMVEVYPFERILHNIMASLRTYVSHDILVVKQLFKGLNYLQTQNPASERYLTALKLERQLLYRHSQNALELKQDFESIKK